MNHLYYGDNLDVLRRYVENESVDLVYLDPPFNSHATYNVLFAEKDGSRSAAQIKAFEDTWQWDQAAAHAYQEVVEMGGKVSLVMQAFRTFLGDNDLLAYLAMMAPRLVELRRTLRPTGSIYLHCDPTASHYLKLLMDAIFDPQGFRNEIVWKRTSSHNDSKRYAGVHDYILYYVRSRDTVWNSQHLPHHEHYVKTHYNRVDDEGRQYRLDNIIRSASMGPRPNLAYEYKGFTPQWGWRMNQEKLEAIDQAGRLAWSASGAPYLVRFLDEMPGGAMPSVWEDIPPINSQAQERLGYPTQKPEALLERIINASSNEGDVVLDPFCGCGTAVAAAQKLNRKWIGIDVTHVAIGLIKHRLKYAFGDGIEKTYDVTGEPTSLPDAENLARDEPFQFQCWALGLVGARTGEQKKGADKGIDGRLYFHDDMKSGQTKQIIFSVKAGHVTVSHMRDLRGVIEREKAQIGVLITMEEPTQPMRKEAAGAGFYDSTWNAPFADAERTRHPRLQILTIEELLRGKSVDRPPHQGNVTFKKAPRVYKKQEEQPDLL